MNKALWEEIAANDYAVPAGHTLAELTDELVSYLGLPDGELRGIAFWTLKQWIVERPQYSPAELRALRDRVLPNLAAGLGENGTDSVFLRTFSVHVLGFIVARDNEAPFLDEAEFRLLLDEAVAYCLAEQDLRGYVPGKGWAHSCAHVADWLGSLGRSRYADTAVQQQILATIATKMARRAGLVYSHGEDERMAWAVIGLMTTDRLALEDWRAWLKQLEAVMDLASLGMPFEIEIYYAFHNTKNLLRNLYFVLELGMDEQPAIWPEFRPELLASIKEVGL